MPSDLDPKEVKKFGSPLLVHTAIERTGPEGVDLSDYVTPSSAPAASASEDGEPSLDWEWDEQGNLTTDSSHRVTGNGAETPRPNYASAKKEVLDGYGIESPRAKALVEAEQDFFRGWSIGSSEEPFKNGGWMENLNTMSGMYYAGGFGG
ncbi:hypothetical protein NDA16_003117 [Ustilago loliicola]|nr:hypothetical protein NDA16_003117 [Ustilago loliicola]